jgi:hypothetical protein
MSVQFSSILRTIILIVLFPGALSACNDVFPLGARSNHHIRKRRRLISRHKQKCCWGLSGGAHFWYTFAFRVRRHEGESVFVSSGRTHSQFALKLFALMQGNRGKSPAALSLFYAGIYMVRASMHDAFAKSSPPIGTENKLRRLTCDL